MSRVLTDNEAAERLRREIAYRVPLTHEYMDDLLDAALDWERRHAVERIAQKIEDHINDPINREHYPEAVIVYQNALGLVLEEHHPPEAT